MNNLSRDAKGWRVRVVVNGNRPPIRLSPKVSQRDAERFAAHIVDLAAKRVVGEPPDAALAVWLARLPPKLHARLAAIGLAEPRTTRDPVTLSQLWERFTSAKVVKPATAAVYARVRKSTEGFFGAATPIDGIGREQVDGWIKALADAGLARATRSKLVHVAKALFARAELWGLLPVSPFRGIKPGPQTNPTRAAYITVGDLEKIMDASPDHQWRCIFALARLAALRCPSELTGLRWVDLDFDASRMVVTSPKTEHHTDGATRIVPIVPRLQSVLMDAFTAAEPGAVYVVPRLRHPDTNLRTHAHRILARAGVQPPPKLFVNLRASCATDWAREHGGHVAAKWCGHSPQIALKHYTQVRPEDFDRATGRAGGPKVAHMVAQHGAEQAVAAPHNRAKTQVFQGCTAGDGSIQETEWAILDSNQ